MSGGGGGGGGESEREREKVRLHAADPHDQALRPWTARRQNNNKNIKAASPRHCVATTVPRNCCFKCCAEQHSQGLYVPSSVLLCGLFDVDGFDQNCFKQLRKPEAGTLQDSLYLPRQRN